MMTTTKQHVVRPWGRWATWLLATLMAALLAAGCSMAIHDLAGTWFDDVRRWVYFFGGCLFALSLLFLLYQNWRYRWFPAVTDQFLFLHRFNHEMAHALTALLTGVGITSFAASSSGGVVQVGRTTAFSPLVAMAPYVMSIPLLALFLFGFFSMRASPALWFLLGAAYSYHLLSTVASMSPGQSDFRQLPYWLCVVWIMAALIMTSGLVWALVDGGHQGVAAFSAQVVTQSVSLAQAGCTQLVGWYVEYRYGHGSE